MRCIFCKNPSLNSKSVEHIIPESLGNKEHILPKGIVCDSCNQYFAKKLEKPLLELPYFVNVRSRNIVESKKGRVPIDSGMVIKPSLEKVNIGYHKGKHFIYFDNEESFKRAMSSKSGSLIIREIPEPERDNIYMSRFLSKVALEFLTQRFYLLPGGLEEILNKKELDPIREYARYGKGKFWIYKQRRIYKETDRFVDLVYHPEPYEILHEIDFLYIDEKVLYFIIVIFGIEYVINMGASEIEIYEKWLTENDHKSPIRRGTEKMIKK